MWLQFVNIRFGETEQKHYEIGLSKCHITETSFNEMPIHFVLIFNFHRAS